jgi:hypothetical protein
MASQSKDAYDERTDDLLVIDDRGTPPSAIGQRSKENDSEEMLFSHEKRAA